MPPQIQRIQDKSPHTACVLLYPGCSRRIQKLNSQVYYDLNQQETDFYTVEWHIWRIAATFKIPGSVLYNNMQIIQ